MLDHRIYTFLKVCETMNYRKAAELLNMTQPAVTQHIHYLEDVYQVKLFNYSGKKLTKTKKGKELEQHARSVVYNEKKFQEEIKVPDVKNLSVGATKTIGNYILSDFIESYLDREDIHFELIIDNTESLIQKLDAGELDFLIIEGYFDKTKYDYKLLQEEEFAGICSLEHRFAGKEVDIEEIFSEHLLIREQGSGTRDVLENFLYENNNSIHSFGRHSVISSLSVIEKMVEKNKGISFVYQSVPEQNENLAIFRIRNHTIKHEFNYVFLKNSAAKLTL